MKTSTNKTELKELNACADGYKTFATAHGDNEVLFSQCLDSNGWDDTWWLISSIYNQLSDEQKQDLLVLSCEYAKVNIEKIKPYCSGDDYKIITDYLNNPADSAARSAARSAAWSAVDSAAWSAAADSAAWSAVDSAARSAAWSATRSAAWSAARSAAWSAAWSAAADSAAWSAAWSAADSANTQKLKELFLKWESQV